MAHQCPSLRSGCASPPSYPALRRRMPSSRRTWMSGRLLLIGWACPSQWPRRQRGMLPWRRGLPSTTLVSITAPMDCVGLSYQHAPGCVLPLPLQPPPPRVPSVDRCVHSPSCHQLQTWRGGDSPCSLCGPQLGAAPPAGRQEERGAVSGSVVLSWGFSPAPQSGGSRQPASRGSSVQGSPGQRRLRLSIASQPHQPQPRLVCCVAILWWFNMHVWHLLLHHTKCHQFLS